MGGMSLISAKSRTCYPVWYSDAHYINNLTDKDLQFPGAGDILVLIVLI